MKAATPIAATNTTTEADTAMAKVALLLACVVPDWTACVVSEGTANVVSATTPGGDNNAMVNYW